MKKIIPLLATVISALLSYGQAPSNDLIANATLVSNFPLDETVDISSASVQESLIGDCVTEFVEVVYYKFMSSQNIYLAATAFNNELSEPKNFFFHPGWGGQYDPGDVTVFTAPNLNVINESELTQITACPENNGSSLSGNIGFQSRSFQAQAGVAYYIQVVKADNADPNNVTRVKIEQVQPLPQSDRDALMTFYNSTNGDNWFKNTYWGTNEEVGSWFGVATFPINGQDRVTTISFLGNGMDGILPVDLQNLSELRNLTFQNQNEENSQLQGPIPDELGNLTELKTLWIMYHENFGGTIPVSLKNCTNLKSIRLNGSELTGNVPIELATLPALTELRVLSNHFSGPFPDFSVASNALNLSIAIAGNHYSFSDLAPTFEANTNGLATYFATPQYSIDELLEINIPIGDEITMEISDYNLNKSNSATVTFQWYKGNNYNNPITGAIERTYTITNAQTSDSGSYFCSASSPILPEITIDRPYITLNVGTVGVADNERPSISIYPNPITNVLNIQTLNTDYNKVFIYDISGKLINIYTLNQGNNAIEMFNLLTGTYILKITNGHMIISKKIIKQ